MYIKPCIVCGRSPILRTNGIGKEKYQLHCLCSMEPDETAFGTSIEEAVEMWNTCETMAEVMWNIYTARHGVPDNEKETGNFRNVPK